MMLDHTHDLALKSWVGSANNPTTDFPIQNLPFGVYRLRGSHDVYRGCVAIGDKVFDLAGVDAETGPTLNALAAAGRGTWRDLRRQLSAALSDDNKAGALSKFLTPMTHVELGLPVMPRDYSDFFTSYYHAYNSGRMFRPNAPLTPNFKWLPIAYHGRASSIVASGTNIRRPRGQRVLPGDEAPTFGPSIWLDYEVELGLVVGPGTDLGATIPIENAEDHIFGVTLLNDWSARDIQGWEYQPLGPFLSKSFATTLSPWIVTLDALAPFRAPSFERFEGDPPALAHLTSAQNEVQGQIDINLEAWITPFNLHTPHKLSAASYASSYWTPAQMVAHHTSNGCPLNPGDILGTGTISGPELGEAGSLLELSQAGTTPLIVGTRTTRTFLEDGDTLTLKGRCTAAGHTPIGFGEATGKILPPQKI
ncbi:MAG: fumarylacetoacetase [Alphaproteobacteria bacterium]|nr:fumarylacetoacetase [Alphaproteobacteria bacterium]